jgi:hypothetical protein
MQSLVDELKLIFAMTPDELRLYDAGLAARARARQRLRLAAMGIQWPTRARFASR